MEFEKISIGLKTHNGPEFEFLAIAGETTNDPTLLLNVLSLVRRAIAGVDAIKDVSIVHALLSVKAGAQIGSRQRVR